MQTIFFVWINKKLCRRVYTDFMQAPIGRAYQPFGARYQATPKIQALCTPRLMRFLTGTSAFLRAPHQCTRFACGSPKSRSCDPVACSDQSSGFANVLGVRWITSTIS